MYTYKIEADQDAPNPRNEFDHLSTFYGVNGRYLIGGKNDMEYRYRDDLEERIKELKQARAVVVEFDSNAGTCYAVIERDEIVKEYIPHGYSIRKALYRARQCAKGEIEEWQAWCDGEVYGYIVENEEGAIVDSCWGFYGYKYAEEEARQAVKNWNDKEQEEQKQIEARLNSI